MSHLWWGVRKQARLRIKTSARDAVTCGSHSHTIGMYKRLLCTIFTSTTMELTIGGTLKRKQENMFYSIGPLTTSILWQPHEIVALNEIVLQCLQAWDMELASLGSPIPGVRAIDTGGTLGCRFNGVPTHQRLLGIISPPVIPVGHQSLGVTTHR
ncbi:hypothetical protein C8Q80DRAFT_1119226 [Daedaleopsis nitida]|nr:hypothetical protein C8Q80DRAFT_1119226 [Daedaleopsis nitida]